MFRGSMTLFPFVAEYKESIKPNKTKRTSVNINFKCKCDDNYLHGNIFFRYTPLVEQVNSVVNCNKQNNKEAITIETINDLPFKVGDAIRFDNQEVYKIVKVDSFLKEKREKSIYLFPRSSGKHLVKRIKMIEV